MLLKSFAQERARFQGLSRGAGSLLISSIAYGAAALLIGLFTYAFIWRQNSDLAAMAIYKAAWMVGVSLAFVINGWLLAACKLTWLYAISLYR